MGSFIEKLKLLFSAVEEFLLPFCNQFLTAVGPIVLAAAEQAVIALATQSMTGGEKQTAAFAKIVEDLKSQGITVAASIINGAIEAAVAKIKAPVAAPATSFMTAAPSATPPATSVGSEV